MAPTSMPNTVHYFLLILFNLVLVSTKRVSTRVRGGRGGGGGTSVGNSPGAIAGIVLGSVAFVICIVAFMVWRKKRLLAEAEMSAATHQTDAANNTMTYAQQAAMEEALASSNPQKPKRFRWLYT